MAFKTPTRALKRSDPARVTDHVENHRTRTGRERRGRTGLRILEAVFRVVDHDGIDRLSIDRVRGIANLSRGSFYNYAATLDEMLSKISFLTWRQINVEQTALFGALGDPLEKLDCYLRYGVARSASDRACGQIMVRSLPLTGSFSTEMRSRLLRDFALAAASRSIDVPSIELAVDLSMGLLLAIMRHAVMHGPDPSVISEQALMVMRALGARKARATDLVRRPLPEAPAIPLREKVLDAGWD